MPNPVMSGRNPVAVNCGTEQLIVFFVGNDGNVYTSWWAGASDWNGLDGWYYLGNGMFPFNGVVGAVGNNSDRIDVFITGSDYQVYTLGGTGTDGEWAAGLQWQGIGGGGGPSRPPVSVVSRYSGQLDAFFCGDNGHVYTSAWSAGGTWSGLNGWRDIGGVFPANAPVAAVSRNSMQLDLFICGTDGHVYTSWWNGVSDWSGLNGWRDIGSSGFPPGAPVAAVSRNPTQLDLFICGTNGHVYTSWWNGVSDWSGLNGWRDIGSSGFAPGAPVAAVSRNPTQLDLFVGGNDYNVYTSWWNGVSDWSGLSGWRNIGGCAPAPSPGLISNANYFLSDNGNNLTSVMVTVKIDTDFVSSENGFSFQLNCWSPRASTTVMQQYVIDLHPDSKQLLVGVDNWKDVNTQVINYWQSLENPLPTAALKAGYLLNLILETDADGNVTAANYSAYDEQSALLGYARILLTDLQQYNSTEAVTTAELAPVVAFTFNIGGYGNGTAATLTSGSGIITYSAHNLLQLDNQDPNFTAFHDGSFDTAETANLVFGTLPPTQAEVTMQEFHYVADHDRAIRQRKGTHNLRVPAPVTSHTTDPAPTA
jgi:hypothetical protein